MDPAHFSNLKWFGKTPAHFLASITTPMASTAPMRVGTITHKMVLGGRSLTIYDGERRGNAWAEFKAANKGKEIVTLKEVDRARPIAEQLKRNAQLSAFLDNMRLEQEIAGTLQGEACEGTPDAFNNDTIIDVKTTADASPEQFPWQVRRMAYGVQVVFYGDLLRAAGLANPQRHIIVGVETKAPYGVTFHELTPRAVDEARRTYSGWLAQLTECKKTNSFPGYPTAILPLDVIGETELDFSDNDEDEAAE